MCKIWTIGWMAGDILSDQIDDILDLWYGFVGSHPHLVAYFAKGAQPNAEYLAKVRQRFGQWILDTCNRDYDQTWLNYQYEIGLRHHSAKKGASAGDVEHMYAAWFKAITLTATLWSYPYVKEGEF
ncbi:MAG: hypothetical protein J0H74_33765 [Chitinophagaceae bacterium]|nr:hypothetical protein [Chitinophagaceae bacterium]